MPIAAAATPSLSMSKSGFINVPSGYGSGNPLSDTATYSGQTFATLGVTPGTYVWSWGEGPNQNFTLNILATPVTVPEPASAGTCWGGARRAAAGAHTPPQPVRRVEICRRQARRRHAVRLARGPHPAIT